MNDGIPVHGDLLENKSLADDDCEFAEWNGCECVRSEMEKLLTAGADPKAKTSKG